jgi:hypothetical protein
MLWSYRRIAKKRFVLVSGRLQQKDNTLVGVRGLP